MAPDDGADAAPTEEEVAALLDDAAELLASRFGGQPALSEAENLGGRGDALVLRVRVSPNPFLTERSVVVKQLPTSAAEGVEPAVLREIAAYQFITALPADVRPGPMLLAHDVDRRLLITTDWGDTETFACVLAPGGDDEVRDAAVRRLGHLLGRMHAGTADREAGFDSLARRMWRTHRARPGFVLGGRDRAIVRAIDLGAALLRRHGITYAPDVQLLIDEAVRRCSYGYHRAFSPFELPPDNIIYGAGSVAVLDYEWAGYRDVSFDLANVIAGFPRSPSLEPLADDEVRIFLDAWLSDVRHVWPDIELEDTLNQRIAVGLLGWVLVLITILHLTSVDEALDAEASIERKLAEGGRDVDDRDHVVVDRLASDLTGTPVPGLVGNRAKARNLASVAGVLRRWTAERGVPFAGCVQLADDIIEWGLAEVNHHDGDAAGCASVIGEVGPQ